ncbi:MAG: ATP-dependent Clp protease ATP-binding subunit [Bacillota bacterium]|nr:ATP-dependent Clp protease ATP-binding subunit [Bacillota bacterium]
MKKCSVCHKNDAVITVERYDVLKRRSEQKQVCLPCAQRLGLFSAEELAKDARQLMNDPNMAAIFDQTFSPELLDQMAKDHGPDHGDSEPNHTKSWVDQFQEAVAQVMKTFEGQDSEEYDDEYDDVDAEDGMFMVDDETEDEPIVSQPESGAETTVRTRRKGKTTGKALRKFGINLIDKAVAGEIDRIIGREAEVDRVVQILNRRRKNNPILVGEPGVGKTTIAEGLAMRIVEGKVPPKLLDSEIVLLDLTTIVAGTQFRGQFEQRMKDIISDATKHGNVILVIDEVHNIMGAGEVHGGVMNAANILKPTLASGQIRLIGATTLEDYRKHIEKDAALERRFQRVLVEEPTPEESVEILEGIKGYYESFHKVKISREVIEAAVQLSERYITDRFLPDKAIDVIDEAGSRANLKNRGLIEQRELTERFDALVAAHTDASAAGDYAKAADLRSQFLRLKNRIDELETENASTALTIEDIAHVVEAWTKIPVQKITEEEAQRLLDLDNRLRGRVVGQERAVDVLAKAVRRGRSGFRRKRKPASFIFVGPTGVGKTELAKALASELFGSDDALIRLDMSEYMEKHTVSKLIGAPPGYVGFEEGGQLTEMVRRRPYSVILLDEIEKAHPDIFNMLLQILDDGRLTDNNGRTTFFENTVLIMTSNIGTSLGSGTIGFSRGGAAQSVRSEERIQDKLKEAFRPEFLNRVDEIAVFRALEKDDLSAIIELQLGEVKQNLAEKKMTLAISDEVKEFLIERGFSPQYGARPLRRAIQRHLEDEIADLYLRRTIREGDVLEAILEDDRIVIHRLG